MSCATKSDSVIQVLQCGLYKYPASLCLPSLDCWWLTWIAILVKLNKVGQNNFVPLTLTRQQNGAIVKFMVLVVKIIIFHTIQWSEMKPNFNTGLFLSWLCLWVPVIICDLPVGYDPSGNGKVHCEADGEWSSTEFMCSIITCSPPAELENAYQEGIMVQGEYLIKSSLQSFFSLAFFLFLFIIDPAFVCPFKNID